MPRTPDSFLRRSDGRVSRPYPASYVELHHSETIELLEENSPFEQISPERDAEQSSAATEGSSPHVEPHGLTAVPLITASAEPAEALAKAGELPRWCISGTEPSGYVFGAPWAKTARKYSMVLAKPSSSVTRGSHANNFLALRMSGRRTLGSSTGSCRC